MKERRHRSIMATARTVIWVSFSVLVVVLVVVLGYELSR